MATMTNQAAPNTVHISPHARVWPLPLTAVRWSEGFWQERFELCRRTIIPGVREAMLDSSNSARLGNFRVGAGIEPGKHEGVNWSDGDCYKWIEAVAHIYAVTRESELDAEMDHWIGLIARTQAPDGYINTQIQLNPQKKRWERRLHHELYNMGHLITAACVHHAATGKTSFLEVAIKAADYLYSVFQPRPKALAHFGFNPSNIMGLVDLYRSTGEARYLELAGIFVDMRGSEPWPANPYGRVWGDDPTPGDMTQDRVALRKETEAVGHAVTGPYLYCGAADVVAETGEQELREALQRIWENVTQRKLYVTGAVGAYHAGVSSRGDMVHEAFGRNWELPNATGYNESCANIAHAMWARRLLALTGKVEFADEMERVLYNSALSPMSLDGSRFCYCNPTARLGSEVPLLNHDTLERWKTDKGSYCCPPQVARTLASLHEWAYGCDAEGLWVHLYGSSEVDTQIGALGRLSLTVRTEYPWDGMVRLQVHSAPATPLSLRVRVPGWATGATITINGGAAEPAAAGEYATVRRTWSAGDTVTLHLPLRVRMVVAHPHVEEARNHVVMLRGPIVYCLEAHDLPADVPIHEVRVPRHAEWSLRHEASLLGGVTVISVEGYRQREPDWTGRLYAEIPTAPAESLAVRMIPYYAWLNRGNCPMRVWLPLA